MNSVNLGELSQKKIDSTEETIQKYYSSGSAQIAVRTITDTNDTLQWLLSVHLGSTSTTANADGTCPYCFAAQNPPFALPKSNPGFFQ